MKKTLLLGTVLMVGVAGYAQSAKTKSRAVISPAAHNKLAPYKKGSEQSMGPKTAQASKGNSHNTTDATCPVSHLSSSYASAGIFDLSSAANSSNRNILTYNKDLNAVVFTHRNSADWKSDGIRAAGTTVPLGSIDVTWWPVSTGIQDSMVLYKSTSSSAGNTNSFRYPGGTVFNPGGNTDITKAFMVATGPILSGTKFVGVAYAVSQPKVPAIYHVNPVTQDNKTCLYGTAPFGNLGGFDGAPGDYGILYNDIQQAGNKVVVAGPLQDVNVTTANGSGVKGAIIAYAKHVGSIGSDSLVWSADSITPGYYLTTGSQGDPTTGDGYWNTLTPRVAFDPTGQIGYVVMMGRLAANYGTSADSMIAPIVYKTTTGGGTWTPVLLGYDWNTGHPEMLRGVGAIAVSTASLEPGYTAGVAPKNFQIIANDPNGNDLTVDANGVLHFVATVQEISEDGAYPDSLGYGYDNSTHYDYAHHHPMIWDLMTDGSCWKTLLVDSINTCYIDGTSTDPTNAYSRWQASGTANSNEGMGAHLTVSRSTDGTIVFYGWAESDPDGTGSSPVTSLIYNTNPDLVMKAYNVNSNVISAKKNFTNGNEDVFNPFLSDISYFDGNNWVVPAVYVTKGRVVSASGPVGNIYDINSAIDYRYTNCGTFSNGEISIPATFFNDQVMNSACTFATSIKNNNNAFASSINNFPNPFSNTTTIAVTLSESKSFDVKVYNTIGTLVYSKKVNGNVGENNVTFDAGALSSGVYYYTVSAGSQQATKKMIIQK